ncbi:MULTISPECIES: nitroreductase family protein [Rhizobium/Agrobacterium group]|uniref:nitroreductase family protein n=1 Tax=Rhizobium/Agrobacterium group TaxID=227290 RepID=UPI001ADB55E8|nr:MULTISPECIES: nitroreductase family protein [Rhizobium/Agrobacterium group]MBO9112488.1 nitroreductase family protein [Agrobacterium sp. S2/73]QXZ75995.1 nitroreductase family protein [Agrobacterium sp. S7/73]QYA16994.1 nitroreductase family protein [Rhizobium sp. AB2/73]UEQ85433.1 nitroreductase family protein [Rhizobium sp. AB2/73]
MIELLKKRRTQYALGRNLDIAETVIEDLAREAIRWSPSPFNSQSSRVVFLFGNESEKLWSIVRREIAQIMSSDTLEQFLKKIDGFAAGVGTILFFEDEQTVLDLQEQWPLFADHFPDWSEQSGGMAQFAVWTALANVGVGASLQHYNPLIDESVKKTWNLPVGWKLRAQMPIGSNEAPVPDKTFLPDALRFRSFR